MRTLLVAEVPGSRGRGETKPRRSCGVVRRWHDCLGVLSTASACLVAFAAASTVDAHAWHGLVLLILYATSCAARAWNPIAWAARPYRVVADRGRGFSSPIADQVLSHVGESCMGALFGLYTAATSTEALGTRHLPRAWLPLLIGALARAMCWCGVVAGEPRAHAVEEVCWLVAGATVAARARTAGHPEIWVFYGAYCLLLALVDVPMYARQALGPRATGAAVQRSLTKPLVGTAYETWKDDMPWLTLYFVLGPWGALFLYQRVAATA